MTDACAQARSADVLPLDGKMFAWGGAHDPGHRVEPDRGTVERSGRLAPLGAEHLDDLAAVTLAELTRKETQEGWKDVFGFGVLGVAESGVGSFGKEGRLRLTRIFVISPHVRVAFGLLSSVSPPPTPRTRAVAPPRAWPEDFAMPPFDDDPSKPTRPCGRCGGNAFYWRQAIVPGDPAAPRGSRRGEAHYQPAWQCLNCGYLEPHERRTRASRGAATERSGM